MRFPSSFPDEVSRLREVDLFAPCSDRELRRIDRLATIVTIPAGHLLCSRGEIGRECFVLLSGRADVDVDGRHHAVGLGATVGEMSLLVPDGHRTATVTAVTDVDALVFSRAEFTSLMQAVPTVAHSILREASRRLVQNHEEQ